MMTSQKDQSRTYGGRVYLSTLRRNKRIEGREHDVKMVLREIGGSDIVVWKEREGRRLGWPLSLAGSDTEKPAAMTRGVWDFARR